MKVTFLSDTHGQHDELLLSGGDLLIHAGDISKRGMQHEVVSFLDWFDEQDYTYKIFIAGNHDFLFERDSLLAQSLIPENITYLNDSCITIEGYKIWGSPVTPFFYNWAFNRHRGADIAKHWALIPDDIDLLVTHGPPINILDQTTRGERVGCLDLMNKIVELHPLYHIFGHIHEARGKTTILNTNYINASVLNERYEKVNDGIDVTIPNKPLS